MADVDNPLGFVKQIDPEVYALMKKEHERLETGLELIASENFVSRAVLQAAGSVLTNKYAEGYPGKRYYGGCVHHDAIEALAIARAKELFGADHANVQPHSGASANFAVYSAVLKPGDTILAMRLDMGGHLTHGSPVNFSGRLYNVVGYGVREDDQRIDYDEVERLAHEHKPKMLVAGASAYPRTIDFPRMAKIARDVGRRRGREVVDDEAAESDLGDRQGHGASPARTPPVIATPPMVTSVETPSAKSHAWIR